MNTTAQSLRVFVYGTLRVGEPYHHLMSPCEYLGQCTTAARFALINLGRYPGITHNGSASIVGDLYLVDAQTLQELDEYEGYPEYYTRESIELSDGSTAIAYIYIKSTDDCPEIPSGDWKKR